MTTSEVIGPIVGGDTVGDALLESLKTWLPTYLAEISRQRDLPAATLPAVATWDLQIPGQRLAAEWTAPAVSVTPVRIERVAATSATQMRFAMLVQVNVYVESTGQQQTFRLAARYAAAVRAALIHHPSLGGLAQTVELDGEIYRGVAADESRYRGGAAVVVRVGLSDGMRLRPELSDPPADPLVGPPDPPQQTSTVIFTDLKD